MKKSTRNLLLFVALFSVFSSVSGLIYKFILHENVPMFPIIGGLVCGFVLTYLVTSYNKDDDFMPKK
nr:hypothetical protein [uncultured Peptostreptococcus sp.]